MQATGNYPHKRDKKKRPNQITDLVSFEMIGMNFIVS